ncbi:hypothetical protein PSMK_25650 [Phycisphaera mikurensis NBRC 102666]|uniref:Uncharacterized protein n=1 Tax=Phycisphaera mikurensis (strain NBRC 102666 / KCTC 22515 / FYK2301M01) TaxID=1142394 RepID=I0IHI6_PHYMF|nr:hypothetical protein PSMK_25650 [Phycisphaera mikurensis NBRC 102666]
MSPLSLSEPRSAARRDRTRPARPLPGLARQQSDRRGPVVLPHHRERSERGGATRQVEHREIGGLGSPQHRRRNVRSSRLLTEVAVSHTAPGFMPPPRAGRARQRRRLRPPVD